MLLTLLEKKRQEIFSSELAILLDRLAERGIIPVLLKGASLQIRLWTGRLRPMLDVDLFIPQERRQDVQAAFQSMGYREKYSDKPDFGFNEVGETVFCSPDRQTLEFEVSTRFNKNPGLENIYRLPPDWMTQDLVRQKWENRPVDLLDPTREFLFLLHHHVNLNYLRSLLSLGDLLQYFHEGPAQDWTATGRLAREHGLGRAFTLAACLADRWLPPLRDSLPPRENLPIVLWDNYLREIPLPWLSPEFDRHKASLRRALLPGFGAQLRFLMARAFPHPDYVCWRHSAKRETSASLPVLYIRYWKSFIREIFRSFS